MSRIVKAPMPDSLMLLRSADEALLPDAEGHRQRHAVDVAAGARLRRVHVAVGVEPDEADALLLLAVVARDAGDRAHRDRVVAAEHDGQASLSEHAVDGVAHGLAGVADLLQVLHVGIAGVVGLLDEDLDVAAVGHLVAERTHAGMDVRHPERGRAHVHSTAAGAEVEGHSDEGDLPRARHARTLACARAEGQRTRRDSLFG
jgi:hypothetical protein